MRSAGTRAFLAFAVLALLYVLPGLLPGKLLVPADIPLDLLAWKGDPSVRVRVSNSLLSDVPLQLIPWDEAARDHLRRGEVPWRNPLAGAGQHLFANPLAALLSPFTWPRLFFGLHGWALTVFLKLFVAAGGMFLLARRLNLGAGAATASGVLYALSGYSIVWALYPHTNVFVLLPAMGAAALAVAERPGGRAIAALAIVSALATAGGHPETLFVGVLAIALWLLMTRARRPLLIGAASLSGFLLVGLQLVPFFFALAGSWILDHRHAQIGAGFRKLSILSLALPGYLGSPLGTELDLSGLFPGGENFHQRNGAFIGAIALLAIVASWRSLDRRLRIGAAIGGAFFLLSLSIPGLSHLVRLVPLFGGTAAEYWAAGFVLFAALAGGSALVALANGPTRRRIGIAALLFAALVALGGMIPVAAPTLLESAARQGVEMLRGRGHLQQPQEVYEARLAGYLDGARAIALRRAVLPAVCWGLAGAALLISPSRKRSVLLGLAVLGELAAFGWGYNPAIDAARAMPMPEAIRQVREADPQGVWRIASSHEVFPPNLSTMYGLADVHAYDILVSREEAESLLPAGYDPLRWTLPPVPAPDQQAALARMGVRWYLTPEGVMEIPGATAVERAENEPPRGLGWGGIVSLVGAFLLAITVVAGRRDEGLGARG